MRARFAFAALLAVGSLTTPAAQAHTPTGLGAALPSACDPSANPGSVSGPCHTDVVQIDRYCPAGTVYEPLREGWTCQVFSLPVRGY